MMRSQPPAMVVMVAAKMIQPVSAPVAGSVGEDGALDDVEEPEGDVAAEGVGGVGGVPQPLEVAGVMSLFVELAHIMSFGGRSEFGVDGVTDAVGGGVLGPGVDDELGTVVEEVGIVGDVDVEGAVVVEGEVVDGVASGCVVAVVVVVVAQRPSVAPLWE